MRINRLTTGHTLRAFEDWDRDVATLYEKALHSSCRGEPLARDALLLPRQGTVLEATCGGESLRINDRSGLWLPRGKAYAIKSENALSDVLWLFLNDKAVAAAVADNRLSAHAVLRLENAFAVALSSWVVTVRERFMFEKIINLNPPELCTHYLEKQIVNGFFQIAFATVREAKETASAPAFPSSPETSPELERALLYIEQNLFERIRLDDIAAYVRQSPRTLNRLFAKGVGESPVSFLRRRRLEECRALLEKGDYRVADLATLADYSDATAFSRAFTQHFGFPPSAAASNGAERIEAIP